MSQLQEIPYEQELLRKGVHMLSLSIPIAYVFVSRELALCFLIPMATISIVLDYFGRKKTGIQNFMHKIFGNMLRPHEYKDDFSLNGASWVLLSACICVFIFPKIITVTGFSILIISDIFAALIGRKYGKHKLFDKSVEGTLAFMLTAIMVVVFNGIVFNGPWTFYVVGIIASIIGAIVEAASHVLKVDDNISIPMSIGFLMWGGGLLAALLHTPFLKML
jgi:dolichol kinase